MQEETCDPNPEYLIKSIAEQGYSLETSVADLIDNSISAGAKRIEVLVDTQSTPLVLFIADDGRGMSGAELKENMKFPSSSIEALREAADLGRFGLGMKTASFAQTRSFTVISKPRDSKTYQARTWDVDHLKSTGKWNIIINSEAEINNLLGRYSQLSEGFLNRFNDYTPHTIIIWHGLYKFEADLAAQDKSEIFQKELSETTREYLQLIFHRFLARPEPLRIRLNNEQLSPFNPFPESARNISVRQKLLMGDNLRLEGFVLPNRSLAESKGASEWTMSHKSLMDMEGIYIYRADRLIVFGGWIGMTKSAPRLQLARLKVEIGNGIDHLFHLNVAKSSIIIPFGERFAFRRYVSELKQEAEKEYYNYETRVSPVKSPLKSIFMKVPTSKGMLLEIDNNFPLLQTLATTLNDEQQKRLRVIFRMIMTAVNKIKKVHEEATYIEWIEKDRFTDTDINNMITFMLESGISRKDVLNEMIPDLGISIQSLPQSVMNLLKESKS
jgi:hypothetical protein